MIGPRHGTGSNLRVPTPRARIRALGGCVLFAVALGLCFFARPLVEPGHFSWLSNFARQLVNGVMLDGGSDKDKNYPEDLHSLVHHGIMSEATFRFITTIKLDGGRPDAHWLYCQGLGVNSPAESVVLASPLLKSEAGPWERGWLVLTNGTHLPRNHGVRIVATNDGGVTQLTEEQFQACLNKSGQARPEASSWVEVR